MTTASSGSRVFHVTVKSDDEVLSTRFKNCLVRAHKTLLFDVEGVTQSRRAFLDVLKSLNGERPVDLLVWDIGTSPDRGDLGVFAQIWDSDPNINLLIMSAFPDYSLAAMRNRFRNENAYTVLDTSSSDREIRRHVGQVAENIVRDEGTLRGVPNRDLVIR